MLIKRILNAIYFFGLLMASFCVVRADEKSELNQKLKDLDINPKESGVLTSSFVVGYIIKEKKG